MQWKDLSVLASALFDFHSALVAAFDEVRDEVNPDSLVIPSAKMAIAKTQAVKLRMQLDRFLAEDN